MFKKNVKTYQIRIIGEVPMLMSNPEVMLMKNENSELGKVIKDGTDIPAIAEIACYRNENGVLYPPRGFLKSGLIIAAVGRKIGAKAGAPKAVKSGIRIKNDYELILLNPKTKKPIKQWDEIYRVTAVNHNTKPPSRVITIRPMIKEWMIEPIIVEVNYDYLTIDHVLELANIAGDMAGCGAYGPRSNGDFGCYGAELME